VSLEGKGREGKTLEKRNKQLEEIEENRRGEL